METGLRPGAKRLVWAFLAESRKPGLEPLESYAGHRVLVLTSSTCRMRTGHNYDGPGSCRVKGLRRRPYAVTGEELQTGLVVTSQII